jgi:hypothetical protein
MYIHKRLVAGRRSYEFAIGYVRGIQKGGIDGSKNKQRRCFYYNPMLLL